MEFGNDRLVKNAQNEWNKERGFLSATVINETENKYTFWTCAMVMNMNAAQCYTTLTLHWYKQIILKWPGYLL